MDTVLHWNRFYKGANIVIIVLADKASGKWLAITTIKFIYKVAQYSLVGGCVSCAVYIGEEGKEPKYAYKDIKLSRYILTRYKKE